MRSGSPLLALVAGLTRQFGTPHFGISALIPCPTPPTLSCLLAARAARLGIYTAYAQRNLVQAQYYRDVDRLDEFLEINEFLRDLNGELKSDSDSKGGPGWREGGGEGVSGLDNFVAIMFDADSEHPTYCAYLDEEGS